MSSSSNQPHTFNPANVTRPPPTYDQVAITPILPTSKIVTLAGQTGIDPTSGTMPTDIVSQSRLAYINVVNCLKAAGATARDIVHVKHYIVDTDSGKARGEGADPNYVDVVERGWGDEWIAFMDREAGGHRPPDTVVGVASLAKREILYECEVWAIVHVG